LLDQIDDEISQFTADGAYDGYPTYDAVLRHSAGARVVIPPRSNAVERPNTQACCQRDDHIASMQADGRLKWQTSTGYGKRALVETAMSRYKGVIGPRLRARSFLAQHTEAAIGVALLTECSPADARNPFVAKPRREQPNKRAHQRPNSAHLLIPAPTPLRTIEDSAKGLGPTPEVRPQSC
jgi:hypothetical protein